MAKQRNALRAGIFMLVSLVLIVFVIVAISGAAKFTQSFKTYPVAFSLQDDIGGLRAGDDVRIGGLKVGSVRDITIDQEKSAVIVIVDIPAKYAIAKDANVQVQHGLTGAAGININDLGTGGALAANEYLRGNPDSLTGLARQLSGIGGDLHKTLANFRVASDKLNVDLDKFAQTSDSFTATGFAATNTVQELHVRIPELLTRVDNLADSGIRLLDTWRNFLGPSSGDFHQTVANLNHVTGDIRQRLPDVLDRLHGILTKVDIAVGRATSALTEIQGASGNLNVATGTLRSILVDNKSKLNSLIESLKATSDNLKYASVEIRHSPWRLLYQPKPDEVANLNIYDSVRQFAEGADSLDDAASALRDQLKDPNADPVQVKRLMQHLDDSFANFQNVQQKLWKEVRE
ncbi:MAG TPA: MlaD family protein [Tepidisphaeraceae bacterium]|jgi:phospholipid/cholesterol/gamma-HCH transport system substrate-binding protein